MCATLLTTNKYTGALLFYVSIVFWMHLAKARLFRYEGADTVDGSEGCEFGNTIPACLIQFCEFSELYRKRCCETCYAPPTTNPTTKSMTSTPDITSTLKPITSTLKQMTSTSLLLRSTFRPTSSPTIISSTLLSTSTPSPVTSAPPVVTPPLSTTSIASTPTPITFTTQPISNTPSTTSTPGPSSTPMLTTPPPVRTPHPNLTSRPVTSTPRSITSALEPVISTPEPTTFTPESITSTPERITSTTGTIISTALSDDSSPQPANSSQPATYSSTAEPVTSTPGKMASSPITPSTAAVATTHTTAAASTTTQSLKGSEATNATPQKSIWEEWQFVILVTTGGGFLLILILLVLCCGLRKSGPSDKASSKGLINGVDSSNASPVTPQKPHEALRWHPRSQWLEQFNNGYTRDSNESINVDMVENGNSYPFHNETDSKLPYSNRGTGKEGDLPRDIRHSSAPNLSTRPKGGQQESRGSSGRYLFYEGGQRGNQTRIHAYPSLGGPQYGLYEHRWNDLVLY